jgi:hypothetical protein
MWVVQAAKDITYKVAILFYTTQCRCSLIVQPTLNHSLDRSHWQVPCNNI